MITTFSVAGLSVVVCTGTFGVLFVVVGFSDDNSSVTKFDAVVVSDDVPVDDVTVDIGKIDSGFRNILSDSPQYKLMRSSDFVGELISIQRETFPCCCELDRVKVVFSELKYVHVLYSSSL